MMRLLFTVFLLSCLSAPAADWITATIHVSTNAPLGNTNSITINGDTRTFTNTVTGSPATLIQQTNSVAYTATNVINHLTTYKANPGYFLSQTASTNVTVRGLVGGAMVVTLAGGWGHVTYSTQTVQTPSIVVRVPVSNEAATNRTTIGSGLATAISDYSTTAIATNAVGLSNFITKGASPLQHIAAPIQVNGGISGLLTRLTNGYATNLVVDSPLTTNLVNYGNAIRSEGTGGNSFQAGSNAMSKGELSIAIGNGAVSSNTTTMAIGTSALALTNYAMAVGNGAQANGFDALAVGRGSQAIGTGAQAIGQGGIAQGTGALSIQSEVQGDYGIGIGPGSSVSATNGTAVGKSSSVLHNDSTAIGSGATSTTTNQVRLGTASETVSVPGMLEAASQTNSTLRGTNILNGRLALTRRENSSPVNGDNAGVILGTNVTISITGPTTIGSYAGFAAEPSDTWHLVRFSGAITNLIRNQSGLDATAANRIITGTGADLSLTNEPSWIQVIYNGSSSRWEVIAHSR